MRSMHSLVAGIGIVAKSAVRIRGLQSPIDCRFRMHAPILDRTLRLQRAGLVSQRLDACRPVGIAKVVMCEVAAIVDDTDHNTLAQSRIGRECSRRSKDFRNGRP